MDSLLETDGQRGYNQYPERAAFCLYDRGFLFQSRMEANKIRPSPGIKRTNKNYLQGKKLKNY